MVSSEPPNEAKQAFLVATDRTVERAAGTGGCGILATHAGDAALQAHLPRSYSMRESDPWFQLLERNVDMLPKKSSPFGAPKT
jgi:hypothetical protein